MPLMHWNDAFETGVDYIDFEHHRLLDLINDISDRIDDATASEIVGDDLGQIHARICAHFALEERLMRRNHYAHYDSHKRHHEKLIEEFRGMMDAFDAGACETCGMRLDECLSTWFGRHLRKTAHRGTGAPR